MAEANPPEDVPSSSVLLGSESDVDYACQPCGYEGRTVEAEGFCLDCCEYLCVTCYKYHKNLAITRYHELVGKDKMPSKYDGNKVKDVCSERCQSHADEVIKYFCPVHKELGCTVCITLRHKLCDDVAYIPEVARDMEDSEDYKSFQMRLKNLISTSEHIIRSTKVYIDTLTDIYTKVLQDIETYKQSVLNRFNELEKDIRHRLEEIRRPAAERMPGVYDTGSGALAELQKISRDYDNLSDKKLYCQMFTDMKHTEQKLSEMKDKLDAVEEQTACTIRFRAGEELRAVIAKQDAFGNVTERVASNINLVHARDISVKKQGKRHTCTVSGATLLSEQKLVITDYYNDTIKLIDAGNYSLMSELKPGSKPLDVARVSQDKAAVTLQNKHKILVLRCNSTLAIDTEIQVNGECRGIDYAQERLFVTYGWSSPKVEILSLSGEVLHSFSTNDQGKQLFCWPSSVCVNTANQTIYVSDWDTHSVLQLDMNGNVRAEYKDHELRTPGKMAADGYGNVYLCGEHSHNIHLLSPACRKVKIFLMRKDELRHPRSVYYCDATDKLYIGMYENENVKVYKVT